MYFIKKKGLFIFGIAALFAGTLGYCLAPNSIPAAEIAPPISLNIEAQPPVPQAPNVQPISANLDVPKVAYKRDVWSKVSERAITVDLKKNTDLAAILKTAHIEDAHLKIIMDAIKKHAKEYRVLGNGSHITIHNSSFILSDALLKPAKVSIVANKKLELTLDKTNKYTAKIHELPAIWQAKVVSGTIKGSLHSSLKQAGAGPIAVREISALLSADAEVQKHIRNGEPFKAMYEFKTDQHGKVAKEVKVIYASVGKPGNAKELYRHADAAKNVDYYDKSGNNIKRPLLRAPISGAKITSSYGYRMHPVLHCNRMHSGVDYSAPKGTPIFAAGDGVISYAKHDSGYGKHLAIRHNQAYSTLYAHLSRFAKDVRPGTKVKQGQLIGYVGATGLASGDHLHFEVMHNGKKVNPAKAKPYKSNPLPAKDLAKFKDNTRKVDQMVAEMDGSGVGRVAMSSMR